MSLAEVGGWSGFAAGPTSSTDSFRIPELSMNRKRPRMTRDWPVSNASGSVIPAGYERPEPASVSHNPQGMNNEQRLRAIFLAIEEFRRLDPEMPTQLVSTFLSVALKPGILASEVAEQIGTTLSSTSRHARDLSDFVHKGKPGYGLIEQRGDPTDRRRRQLHLTIKGQRFVSVLLATTTGAGTKR
jgi:DNA-binding MarR family transcriptional regulator